MSPEPNASDGAPSREWSGPDRSLREDEGRAAGEEQGGADEDQAAPRAPSRADPVEDAPAGEPTLRQACHLFCPSAASTEALWAEPSRWPPDAFAITSVLLEETGAYRLIVSPPEGASWPGRDDWIEWVRRLAADWVQSIEDHTPPPDEVVDFHGDLQSLLGWPLSRFDELEARDWEPVRRLLEMNAIADEACAGLGMPRAMEDHEHTVYHARARALLSENGSLGRFPAHLVRVLPKLRTPQVGITLRSLSQHVSADRTGIDVQWRMINDVGDDEELKDTERLNLLLVPWPLRIEDAAFRPVPGPLDNLDTSHFGFFEFAPEIEDFEEAFEKVVKAAKRHEKIHAVVLPEAALSVPECDGALSLLKDEEVALLISGVRGESQNLARLAECMTGSKEYYDQHKHHRWCMERGQIEQYELGFVLHPGRRWWENIDVRPRSLQFVIANEWLTICPLICEDLARIDPGQARAGG